jgi:hypothetical protein
MGPVADTSPSRSLGDLTRRGRDSLSAAGYELACVEQAGRECDLPHTFASFKEDHFGPIRTRSFLPWRRARDVASTVRIVKGGEELGMSEPNAEIRAEIQALETVLSALAPLDEVTRRRVLDYVQERFGSSVAEKLVAQPPVGGRPEGRVEEEPVGLAVITDIRNLKEQKQPKSAVEMAVLVAYYLSEVATTDERKATIGTADITKYFKQGDYPLPSQPRVILHRAKNAGYLDPSSRAKYKLNPVGHNLVAHGLPRSEAKQASTTRPTRKRANTVKKSSQPKPKAPKKRVSRTKPRATRKKR